MIYFNSIFAVLGTISFGAMAGFLIRERFRWAKTVRRSLLMAVLWLGFAGLLHLLLTSATSFIQGLPASILNMDVRHSFYGRVAIAELTRRSESGQTGPIHWDATSKTLIANTWWLDDPDGHTPNNDGQMQHPGTQWFHSRLSVEALPADAFVAWLNVDPPPLFTVPDALDSSSNASDDGSWEIVINYGREWNHTHKIPYEVSGFAVQSITVNGIPVESWDLTEAAESESEAGRYAQSVEWKLSGLSMPSSSGDLDLRVEYTLSAEPGQFQDVGPIYWNTTIPVR